MLCAVVHQISEIIEYSHEHHLAVLVGCLNYHVPLSNFWLAGFKCGQSQLLLLSILCMFLTFIIALQNAKPGFNSQVLPPGIIVRDQVLGTTTDLSWVLAHCLKK